jgi:DNA-binding transcriptional LysR family regulator
MNPTHIDPFRAVMRHCGMTRAATAHGIGQPHVSRAIAQLEADLGSLLFVRGHGSALPTEEGEAFSREVERTYAGLDHLRWAACQIRELGTGPTQVACQPSLAARMVPRAIRRLSSTSPACVFRFTFQALTRSGHGPRRGSATSAWCGRAPATLGLRAKPSSQSTRSARCHGSMP